MCPQIMRAGGGEVATVEPGVGVVVAGIGDPGGRDTLESSSEKFFDPSQKRAVPTVAV
jgi:hypothetical protein